MLIAFFRRISGADRRDELVGNISRRAYATVRNAVDKRVAQMCTAEARGYVRVKAMPIVRETAYIMLRRETRLPERERALICSTALERLVNAVVRDLRQGRPAAEGRRIAA